MSITQYFKPMTDLCGVPPCRCATKVFQLWVVCGAVPLARRSAAHCGLRSPKEYGCDSWHGWKVRVSSYHFLTLSNFCDKWITSLEVHLLIALMNWNAVSTDASMMQQLVGRWPCWNIIVSWSLRRTSNLGSSLDACYPSCVAFVFTVSIYNFAGGHGSDCI